MKPNQKATAVGTMTLFGTPGLIATIDYLWMFTGLPELPIETVSMIAGIIAFVAYRVLPASDRS